ncbi:aminoglycoside phosphotransferase [Tanticharoenia sakaeratensis NBRC 103193]|uniref:Aminoglycoside phosphotransferase n=2 Tax=Tanticharoenia TaxID=444052 RepID=A0A0D6MJC7_9PROT|nr:aminoglycoside phosphotransferase [Tanticharoenia sakaeratensis NBRC 103193]GBQ17525.1 fructosamine-3-kinase [Tanticharoenia sakaeratensis NBRC 103193]
MELARAAAVLMGSGITGVRPMGGGDLSEIMTVWLDDGRPVVVKNGPAPRIEADMLWALRAAGAPAPEVLAVDDTVLVLEWIDGTDPMRSAWTDLGRVLRTLHAADPTALAPSGHYGWARDFAFGNLTIGNGFRDDWALFWAEQRLLVHVPHVAPAIARRLESLARTIPDRLPARPTPALLHGDLWSGNVLAKDGRISALVDPACCIGHAEADFAMLTLFARPTSDFWEAYGPREPGSAERVTLYRLWPALVHLRLFGSAYHDMVTALLAEVKA